MKDMLTLERNSTTVVTCLDACRTLHFRLFLKNGNLVDHIITKIDSKPYATYSHVKYVYKLKKYKKININNPNLKDMIQIDKEFLPLRSENPNTIRTLVKELLSTGYQPYT